MQKALGEFQHEALFCRKLLKIQFVEHCFGRNVQHPTGPSLSVGGEIQSRSGHEHATETCAGCTTHDQNPEVQCDVTPLETGLGGPGTCAQPMLNNLDPGVVAHAGFSRPLASDDATTSGQCPNSASQKGQSGF